MKCELFFFILDARGDLHTTTETKSDSGSDSFKVSISLVMVLKSVLQVHM